MQNWLAYLNIATIIFVAGVSYASLQHMRSEVRDLWKCVTKVDDRETRHHQRYLVILTMLAASHNPANAEVHVLLKDLAGNGSSQD